MKAINKPEDLTVDDVEKVYIGQARMCCCGCSGDYFYADHPQFKARLASVMQAATERKGRKVEVGDGYVLVETAREYRIIYWHEDRCFNPAQSRAEAG